MKLSQSSRCERVKRQYVKPASRFSRIASSPSLRGSIAGPYSNAQEEFVSLLTCILTGVHIATLIVSALLLVWGQDLGGTTLLTMSALCMMLLRVTMIVTPADDDLEAYARRGHPEHNAWPVEVISAADRGASARCVELLHQASREGLDVSDLVDEFQKRIVAAMDASIKTGHSL